MKKVRYRISYIVRYFGVIKKRRVRIFGFFYDGVECLGREI